MIEDEPSEVTCSTVLSVEQGTFAETESDSGARDADAVLIVLMGERLGRIGRAGSGKIRLEEAQDFRARITSRAEGDVASDVPLGDVPVQGPATAIQQLASLERVEEGLACLPSAICFVFVRLVDCTTGPVSEFQFFWNHAGDSLRRDYRG